MSLRIWLYRPAFVSALEEFKQSVYGDNYEEENDAVGNGKASEASKKRKAVSENAVKESGNYDWVDLADNGKVKLKMAFLYFNTCGFYLTFLSRHGKRTSKR